MLSRRPPEETVLMVSPLLLEGPTMGFLPWSSSFFFSCPFFFFFRLRGGRGFFGAAPLELESGRDDVQEDDTSHWEDVGESSLRLVSNLERGEFFSPTRKRLLFVGGAASTEAPPPTWLAGPRWWSSSEERRRRGSSSSSSSSSSPSRRRRSSSSRSSGSKQPSRRYSKSRTVEQSREALVTTSSSFLSVPRRLLTRGEASSKAGFFGLAAGEATRGGGDSRRPRGCHSTWSKKACVFKASKPPTWNIVDFVAPRRFGTCRSRRPRRTPTVDEARKLGNLTFSVKIFRCKSFVSFAENGGLPVTISKINTPRDHRSTALP
mmetsp:Transcript_3871/g.12621  ORF Transcript_3871/g.12621 Transcript_3871/m.12621 type:complete len:320 (+) Transcript_3871:329-1288(+)